MFDCKLKNVKVVLKVWLHLHKEYKVKIEKNYVGPMSAISV